MNRQDSPIASLILNSMQWTKQATNEPLSFYILDPMFDEFDATTKRYRTDIFYNAHSMMLNITYWDNWIKAHGMPAEFPVTVGIFGLRENGVDDVGFISSRLRDCTAETIRDTYEAIYRVDMEWDEDTGYPCLALYRGIFETFKRIEEV